MYERVYISVYISVHIYLIMFYCFTYLLFLWHVCEFITINCQRLNSSHLTLCTLHLALSLSEANEES